MKKFGLSLNTSTIKGQGLGILEEIKIASEAGYDGIELWVSELDAFTAKGGKLGSIREALEAAGVKPVNLIAFFAWAVDEREEREKGIAEARRVFAMARDLGCGMVAAPPMGLIDKPVSDLMNVTKWYRALLVAGEEYGVTPVLEFWGMAKSLGRLGEAVFVASEADHPNACILADAFHMYKKGTPASSLRMISSRALGLFHINDYPSDPPRETITDALRVYPGDGIAPLREMLGILDANGYNGMISLELFNNEYWKRDALSVAKEGAEKIAKLMDF